MASRLKSDVFLWECMGLEPEYVRIMQRDWMKDNICTITNTYPDHEDIQGPGAVDVARSIADFIAPKSKVLTAEENMFPILSDKSQDMQSRISGIQGQTLNSL